MNNYKLMSKTCEIYPALATFHQYEFQLWIAKAFYDILNIFIKLQNKKILPTPNQPNELRFPHNPYNRKVF